MSKEMGIEVEYFDAERLWSLPDQTIPEGHDTPFFGWQSCYAAILGRLRERGARVLLTGHGGDDLLKGSPLIYLDRLKRGDLRSILEVVRHARSTGEPATKAVERLLARPLLPPSLRRILRRFHPEKRNAPLPEWIRPEFARRNQLAERLRGGNSPILLPRTAREQIFSEAVGTAWYSRAVHWHDRNAARFGIEARHPFLDRRLFEFVLSIPPQELYQPGCYKSFLRRSMQGILPERVRCRSTKTRFVDFLDLVLRREVDTVSALLTSPLSAEAGFLDSELLRQAFSRYRTQPDPRYRSHLWYAITFEMWLRRHNRLLRFNADGRRIASEVA
jgi:asparagine synthase (glutamine-hydrolysing)